LNLDIIVGSRAVRPWTVGPQGPKPQRGCKHLKDELHSDLTKLCRSVSTV